MTTNAIRRELWLPQPRERVWRAIASSAALADWLYPNDFEPRVGHAFTFRVPANPRARFDGLSVRCTVLECDPPVRLAFSWSAAELIDTRVSFQLDADGEGTHLLFEHGGFDVDRPRGLQAFKGAAHGWTRMLGQLQATIANEEGVKQ